MLGAIVMSCGLTAAMSLAFNRELRLDMMVTGFVCAVVIDRIINRITGQYRLKLEQRVRERTAELESVNRELMVRDRMASAGMLAAGVSHEIRSPLQVIAMAANEIREVANPETRPIVDDIASAASAIATILRDLSSIARPVDDPIAPVDLSEVVASASRLASYKLGPRVRLEHGSLAVPAVVGNTSRLLQLLLNLVVNAARASRDDALNVIRVSAATRGDAVVLAVEDTGTGMSADTLARVFEPFFTTGGKTGGTGLGLPICKSIVERMGGAIEIASTLGAGTTVSVRLKVAPAPEVGVAAAA
jgi:signal transduction histidine kinase